MIRALLQGLMNLIIMLVSLILAPIDAIIVSVMPDLSNAMSQFGTFLNYVSVHIGWAIKFTGLSSNAIGLMVMFLGFKYTAPLMFYTVKLALKWYNRLKP